LFLFTFIALLVIVKNFSGGHPIEVDDEVWSECLFEDEEGDVVLRASATQVFSGQKYGCDAVSSRVILFVQVLCLSSGNCSDLNVGWTTESI
jgi:hypothetical protein